MCEQPGHAMRPHDRQRRDRGCGRRAPRTSSSAPASIMAAKRGRSASRSSSRSGGEETDQAPPGERARSPDAMEARPAGGRSRLDLQRARTRWRSVGRSRAAPSGSRVERASREARLSRRCSGSRPDARADRVRDGGNVGQAVRERLEVQARSADRRSAPLPGGQQFGEQRRASPHVAPDGEVLGPVDIAEQAVRRAPLRPRRRAVRSGCAGRGRPAWNRR